MVSVKEILDLLHKHGEKYIWKGDLEFQIERFCSLSVLKVRSITWAKTEEKIRTVPEEMLEELLIVSTYLENDELPPRGNYIFCDNPKKVFFSILASFFSAKKEKSSQPRSGNSSITTLSFPRTSSAVSWTRAVIWLSFINEL